MWKPKVMLRSRTNSPSSVPKPIAAGIGLLSRTPHALTEFGLRLPSLALGAAHEAWTRYERYAQLGNEILAGADDEDSGEDPAKVASDAAMYEEDEDEEFSQPGAGFAPSDDTDDEEAPRAGFAPTPTTGAAGAEALARAAEDRDRNPANVPNAHDLPIDDYDGLTLPQIRARMRLLTAAQLELLRDYESAHARRLPILTMFENRLHKLTGED